MVMSRNILEVMLFILSCNSNDCCCCILMQILCVVSQKSFSFWGTSSPRLPPGALSLDPTGGLRFPRPQSSFISPNNPVISTPLLYGSPISTPRSLPAFSRLWRGTPVLMPHPSAPQLSRCWHFPTWNPGATSCRFTAGYRPAFRRYFDQKWGHMPLLNGSGAWVMVSGVAYGTTGFSGRWLLPFLSCLLTIWN